MMLKKLYPFIKNSKDKLFAGIVGAYIFALYVRIVYLSCQDIYVQINEDYYNYLINKQKWLLENSAINIDVCIILFFSAVILFSLYLLYKKNRYFYTVLLLPVFLGLAFVILMPLYMLLNSN